MSGYLIKDTTREERKKIVEESLGNIEANCDVWPDLLKCIMITLMEREK